VPVNPAAPNRDLLIENELFGHRRGVTDACGDPPGRVAHARAGTPFLDERHENGRCSRRVRQEMAPSRFLKNA